MANSEPTSSIFHDGFGQSSRHQRNLARHRNLNSARTSSRQNQGLSQGYFVTSESESRDFQGHFVVGASIRSKSIIF